MSTQAQPDSELTPYENIDRLLAVEMRIGTSTMGMVPEFYRLVRGTLPISYQICKALLDRPNAKIVFMTGLYLPPHFPLGEVDGPIGSAVFARALTELGYNVSILMEGELISIIDPVLEAAGVGDINFLDGNAVGPDDVRAMVNEFDVVVASERLGVNAKGVRHTINGTRADITSTYPWPDELINSMNQAGKLTIGIGDGGNEIGFGKIYKQIREFVPNGRDCRCECQDGIITVTETEILFPVNVSNFGVYGIVAALGLATGRPELLHDADTEQAVLSAAIRAGFVDGGTGLPEEAEDGIPADGAIAFVTLLQAIVNNALRNFVRPF